MSVLEIAYKGLNYEEYAKIIADTLVPLNCVSDIIKKEVQKCTIKFHRRHKDLVTKTKSRKGRTKGIIRLTSAWAKEAM